MARARRQRLVGRDRECTATLEALEVSLAGMPQVVVVRGEPGIGKTRLAEELVECATLRGVPVSWGRCAEHAGAPPFWPWRQIAKSLPPGEESDGSSLFTAGGPGGDNLSDRFEQFETIASRLHAAASSAGLVVVVDDVQWMDEASASLLTYLVQHHQRERMLLMLTARVPDLDERHPVVAAELARQSHVQRLALRPLHHREVGAQLRNLFGPAELDDVAINAIAVRSGGNPFFAGELARTAVASHGMVDAGGGLPATVRETMRQRLARLPAHVRHAAEAAAIIDRGISVGLVAEMLASTPLQAVEALEAAATAAVLVPDVGLGTYRFVHPLLAEAIVHDIPRDRRANWHRRALDAIVGVHSSELDDWAGELARHALSTRHDDDRASAVRWAEHGIAVAMGLLAWEEATRLAHLALQGPGKVVR